MQNSFFIEEEYDKLGINENIINNISFENVGKFISVMYGDKLYSVKGILSNKITQIMFVKRIRDRDVLFMDLKKEEIIKEGMAVLLSLKIRLDYFMKTLNKKEKDSLEYKKNMYAIYNILKEKERIENKIQEIYLVKEGDDEFNETSKYFISNLSMCEKWGVCIHDYALVEPYSRGCLNLSGGELISILPTKEEWEKRK